MAQHALIAMSGGVDSSVAAWLTIAKGYQCSGAIMQLHASSIAQSICDAQAVADKLQIPFHVIDCTAAFKEKVMDAFVNCYECGLTPNPCIECNKHLKFDRFLDFAQSAGYEYIVTGHYARIKHDPQSGRYLLYKAVDPTKDQSYFLYCLTQRQLSHSLLPLGELTKEQVRKIAAEQGFINATKKDSQDICFVPDGDYLKFMMQHTGKVYPKGNYLDINGKVIGTHKGAVGYTLGQRKGLGIAMGEPVYVCGKNMENNTVTVGSETHLFHSVLRANDWNWFPFSQLTEPIRVMAKTRSRQTEQPATVYPEEAGWARVEFDQPQRAITPGQAVVLYHDDLVIGGGTIRQIL